MHLQRPGEILQCALNTAQVRLCTFLIASGISQSLVAAIGLRCRVWWKACPVAVVIAMRL